MRRHAPRDDRRERIEGPLPGRAGHVGVTAEDDRSFVEAVLCCYRAGAPWRDLPDRFGVRKKAHARFGRRAETGVWGRAFRRSAGDADSEHALLDSAILRAYRRSAGAVEKGATRRPGATAAARA